MLGGFWRSVSVKRRIYSSLVPSWDALLISSSQVPHLNAKDVIQGGPPGPTCASAEHCHAQALGSMPVLPLEGLQPTPSCKGSSRHPNKRGSALGSAHLCSMHSDMRMGACGVPAGLFGPEEGAARAGAAGKQGMTGLAGEGGESLEAELGIG